MPFAWEASRRDGFNASHPYDAITACILGLSIGLTATSVSRCNLLTECYEILFLQLFLRVQLSAKRASGSTWIRSLSGRGGVYALLPPDNKSRASFFQWPATSRALGLKLTMESVASDNCQRSSCRQGLRNVKMRGQEQGRTRRVCVQDSPLFIALQQRHAPSVARSRAASDRKMAQKRFKIVGSR